MNNQRDEIEFMRNKVNRISLLLGDFFHLLEIEEESDSGTPFHPNRITSCRVLDSAKLAELIKDLKTEIQ